MHVVLWLSSSYAKQIPYFIYFWQTYPKSYRIICLPFLYVFFCSKQTNRATSNKILNLKFDNIARINQQIGLTLTSKSKRSKLIYLLLHGNVGSLEQKWRCFYAKVEIVAVFLRTHIGFFFFAKSFKMHFFKPVSLVLPS